MMGATSGKQRIGALGAAALLALLFASACSGSKEGVVDLHRLGLDNERDLISADDYNNVLPPLGEEFFLVVTDLGTCLECKKTAIWISNIWRNHSRPKYLVYLDTLRSEFDREATREFVAGKKLRGLHYFCNNECLDKLATMLGERPPPPAFYFVSKGGLLHWKGGYLPAYGPVLEGIRAGKYDVPLSVIAKAKEEPS